MIKTVSKRETLKNLIVFFTFKVHNLTPTKLVKLIYLADLYHYKKYRCTISDIPFFRYHYGPWHPSIEKTVVEECGELIEIESVQTRKGEVIKIHKPKVQSTEVQFAREEILKTLELVINKWGRKSTDEIVRFIKRNTPFIEARKGDFIDFMLVDSKFRESISRASNQAKEGKLSFKSPNEL